MGEKFSITAVFFIVMLVSGCDLDERNIRDGTYKGTLTVTYSSGTYSGNTTLELRNGRFSVSPGATGIPAGGSGTFSSDRHKITFNDENLWLTHFDGNLVLSGKYGYTFDGEELTMRAERNGVIYEYNLEKQ